MKVFIAANEPRVHPGSKAAALRFGLLRDTQSGHDLPDAQNCYELLRFVTFFTVDSFSLLSETTHLVGARRCSGIVLRSPGTRV